MQDNKKNSKKNSGSGLVWVIIIAVVYAIQGIADRNGGSGLFIVLILGMLLIALIAVPVYVYSLKNKTAKSGTWQARTPFSLIRQQNKTADFRSARSARSNCEYGDANHKYSHDLERRIMQLDGFLKNGIISREEYKVLLDRYTKSASIEL